MDEDRGVSAERLVTFTDAVVAIAITLLALPLGEIPSELVGAGLWNYLDDKGLALLGFAISFFVIARLWWAHHRIFQHVVRWDRRLVVLTVLWLFTIVLLPPATALTKSNDPAGHPEVVAVYLGVMTASSALLTALALHVRRTPSLTDGHDADAERRLFNSVETTIAFAIALVVGTLFPLVNSFALLSLLVTGLIGSVIWRRRHPRA